MKNKVSSSSARRLMDDEHADVLGMPLHLAILIIIAGLSLVTIIAWVSYITPPKILYLSIHDPASPGEDLDFVDEGTDSVMIKVVDADEDGVKGVGLKVSGCGATWNQGNNVVTHVVTGDDGTVTADLVTSTSSSTCDVTITAFKADWPSQTMTVIVIGS